MQTISCISPPTPRPFNKRVATGHLSGILQTGQHFKKFAHVFLSATDEYMNIWIHGGVSKLKSSNRSSPRFHTLHLRQSQQPSKRRTSHTYIGCSNISTVTPRQTKRSNTVRKLARKRMGPGLLNVFVTISLKIHASKSDGRPNLTHTALVHVQSVSTKWARRKKNGL